MDLLLIIIASYSAAVLFYPLVHGRAGIFCSFGLLFVPLLASPEALVARSIGAFLCLDLHLKLFACGKKSRSPGSFGAYLRFLIPLPVLNVNYGSISRALFSPRHLLKFLLYSAICSAGVSLVFFLHKNAFLTENFWLDHLVKMGIFVLTIECASRATLALERALGFDSTALVRNLLNSLTVGEFWQRYNSRVRAWLSTNVFRALGGRRSALRNTILTFAYSGIVHEILFAVITLRVDGYQLAFFLLQAPAVMISVSQAEFSAGSFPRQLLSRVFTISWLVLTSVLFFHGVNRVFPWFYSSLLPLP